MFYSFISSLALFSLVANAAIQPDEHPLPRNTKTVKVEG